MAVVSATESDQGTLGTGGHPGQTMGVHKTAVGMWEQGSGHVSGWDTLRTHPGLPDRGKDSHPSPILPPAYAPKCSLAPCRKDHLIPLSCPNLVGGLVRCPARPNQHVLTPYQHYHWLPLSCKGHFRVEVRWRRWGWPGPCTGDIQVSRCLGVVGWAVPKKGSLQLLCSVRPRRKQ